MGLFEKGSASLESVDVLGYRVKVAEVKFIKIL
jgi:hypothetical protein